MKRTARVVLWEVVVCTLLVAAPAGADPICTKLIFDRELQTRQHIVPLGRDRVEPTSHRCELPGLELPYALAPLSHGAHQACVGEHAQVLRHGLAGDVCPDGQASDGCRPASAEHGDELQASLVTQRREYWRGASGANQITLIRRR